MILSPKPPLPLLEFWWQCFKIAISAVSFSQFRINWISIFVSPFNPPWHDNKRKPNFFGKENFKGPANQAAFLERSVNNAWQLKLMIPSSSFAKISSFSRFSGIFLFSFFCWCCKFGLKASEKALLICFTVWTNYWGEKAEIRIVWRSQEQQQQQLEALSDLGLQVMRMLHGNWTFYKNPLLAFFEPASQINWTLFLFRDYKNILF